jgi:hypothetical protein
MIAFSHTIESFLLLLYSIFTVGRTGMRKNSSHYLLFIWLATISLFTLLWCHTLERIIWTKAALGFFSQWEKSSTIESFRFKKSKLIRFRLIFKILLIRTKSLAIPYIFFSAVSSRTGCNKTITSLLQFDHLRLDVANIEPIFHEQFNFSDDSSCF